MERCAEAAAELSRAELHHYSRHLLIPEVGAEGQRRLKEARVLLVGAGGLGSPAALYLAAAGVGRLGLVEFDAVDASNLQRQVLYGADDVGRPKVEAALQRLRGLNPHIELVPHAERLQRDNALALLRPYDLVVDGTDNFATRYLVNDACVLLGKPNVYASVFRFEGQLSVFGMADGPCYRCLYPEPPPPGFAPSCAEGGVFGVLPGILGAMQAAEAIKLIVRLGQPMAGRLLQFDAAAMSFREFEVRRDPDCPACGRERATALAADYEAFCGLPSACDAPVPLIEPRALAAQRASGTPLQLVDVRSVAEHALVHIEGARLLPLDELEARLRELDPALPTVCYCKSGLRSEDAVRRLRAAGFADAASLRGGILAWGADVDRSLAIY